ncbi:hypothetical protein YC2023_094380 [Brassica napus]
MDNRDGVLGGLCKLHETTSSLFPCVSNVHKDQTTRLLCPKSSQLHFRSIRVRLMCARSYGRWYRPHVFTSPYICTTLPTPQMVEPDMIWVALSLYGPF